MNVHEFAELAAGHALHALSAADEQAFQAARAEHPEWAAIVESDVATAAALADGVAAVEPPAAARASILAAIASEQPADSTDAAPALAADASPAAEPPLSTEAVQTISRRQWMRGLLALAASFVLLVAIGTGAAILGNRLNEPAAVQALNQIESAPDAQSATAPVEGGGHATLSWSDDVGKAVVVTEDVAKLDPDQAYELWFARGGVMVSAGVFTAGADGSATALLNGPIEDADAVAITVEQAGGSPSGQPTSDPITTLPTT